MHVLITGGAGFNGAQLALHLKERGHCVTAMDNLARRGSELNLTRFRRHGIEFIHGDVRNPEDFAQLPEGIDLICEASAQASVVSGYANPEFDITNNALGLVHTLEFARRSHCPLIFWSTNRVYSAERINAIPRRELATRWEWDAAESALQQDNSKIRGFDPEHGFSEEFTVDGGGRSIYGLSKLMGDLACQEYAQAFGVKTVINRFGVISGEGQFGKPDQGWVVWWAAAIHFGQPLTYIGWGGKQVRDVLFIEDVCRLVELEMENIEQISGEVFNVGGGRGNSVSLIEANALFSRILDRHVQVAVEARPRKADQVIYITDNRKAQRLLGWAPRVGLEQGFERIVRWIDENEEALRELYVDSSDRNSAVLEAPKT